MRTLFIVASKSGGTTETASFAAYFYATSAGALRRRGRPPLRRHHRRGHVARAQALDQHFRAVFINPPDIGGRYSALSFFGLVPAALTGLDLDELLGRATAMAESAGRQMPAAENPGLVFGAALGELALARPRQADARHLAGDRHLRRLGRAAGRREHRQGGHGILPVDLEPPARSRPTATTAPSSTCAWQAEPDAAQDQPWRAISRRRGSRSSPCSRTSMTWAASSSSGRWRWPRPARCWASIRSTSPTCRRARTTPSACWPSYEKTGAAAGRGAGPGDAPSPSPSATTASPPALRASSPGAAGDYVALQAYVCPSEPVWTELQRHARPGARPPALATTLGYGPRFLHSTGQYHKGGPNKGVFLQLVGHDPVDVAMPGPDVHVRRAQARPGAGRPAGACRARRPRAARVSGRRCRRPVCERYCGRRWTSCSVEASPMRRRRRRRAGGGKRWT